MTIQLKKGSFFIKNGKMFRVEDIQLHAETKQKILVYRPIFSEQPGSDMVCRIPLENIDKIGAREPFSKKTWQSWLNNLQKVVVVMPEVTPEFVKANEQDPDKLLSAWWVTVQEEKNSQKPLTYTQKHLISQIKQTLSEEIAMVFELELSEAEAKLDQAYELALT